jgi:hypothetical protein
MVLAMQLVLYSVLARLSEMDERFAAAVREGFEEAELGVKILAVRGPGEERRAEGAMLADIICQMKAQMFETEPLNDKRHFGGTYEISRPFTASSSDRHSDSLSRGHRIFQDG